MRTDEVLWDVGANTGIYALYAAKVRGVRVLAFEPSAATYALLVRNIELNGLSGLVDAYCLAFDAKTRLDYLHMAHTEGGHSMHAFGQKETSLGAIDAVFRQSVAGFTIDAFSELFAPPPPANILLDVDSIELAVLQGAARTLANHVRTVMVEIQGTNRSDGGGSDRRIPALIGVQRGQGIHGPGRQAECPLPPPDLASATPGEPGNGSRKALVECRGRRPTEALAKRLAVDLKRAGQPFDRRRAADKVAEPTKQRGRKRKKTGRAVHGASDAADQFWR